MLTQGITNSINILQTNSIMVRNVRYVWYAELDVCCLIYSFEMYKHELFSTQMSDLQDISYLAVITIGYYICHSKTFPNISQQLLC